MYTALDKVTHADLRLAPVKGYAFASELTVAALSGAEVADASTEYPIVFLPQGQSLLPQALLGLTGYNTYLDKKQNWTANYIPAAVRKYPFALATVEETGNYVLAIDTDAPQIQTKEGEALVTAEGELSELTQSAVTFLTQLQVQHNQTAAALLEVEQAGVLEDKTLRIQDGENTRLIGGFRTANLDKLAALDDATLAKWARNGVLQIVYAHINSLRHLNKVAVASDKPTLND